MAVTPYNIIQGPGTLYVCNWAGATMPNLTTLMAVDPSTVSPTTLTGCVDVGGTTGGITVEVDETMSNITVDQILDPVGARATARTIQVTTTMMETELSNLLLALNGNDPTVAGSGGGTITGGADTDTYQQLDLTTTTSATQPIYSTIIVDGWGPTDLTTSAPMMRRFIIPKALSAPKISQKFAMADQATVAVTFTAFYTGSTTTSPITVIDQKVATSSGS
jgi:hypothetical protein